VGGGGIVEGERIGGARAHDPEWRRQANEDRVAGDEMTE
jgi:hypothetical protein